VTDLLLGLLSVVGLLSVALGALVLLEGRRLRAPAATEPVELEAAVVKTGPERGGVWLARQINDADSISVEMPRDASAQDVGAAVHALLHVAPLLSHTCVGCGVPAASVVHYPECPYAPGDLIDLAAEVARAEGYKP
jgi:hypothetical protein